MADYKTGDTSERNLLVPSRNVQKFLLPKGPDTVSIEERVFWRFNDAGKNNTYFSLHVKRLTFFPVLTKSVFSRQVFKKVLNVKFNGNPSGQCCSGT
jgi:hypothetical protein